MLQTKVVETIKTHLLMFSNILLEVVTSYEILWKNMVELDGQQMVIYYGACRATPARIQTHIHILILIFNSSMKYFVARKECEWRSCCIFLAILHTFMLLRVICAPTTVQRERTVAYHAKAIRSNVLRTCQLVFSVTMCAMAVSSSFLSRANCTRTAAGN